MGNDVVMSPVEYAGSDSLRPKTKIALALVALCLLLLAADIVRPMMQQEAGQFVSGSEDTGPYRPSILGLKRSQVEGFLGAPRRVEVHRTKQGRRDILYYQRRRGPGYLRVEYENGAVVEARHILSLP